MEFILKTDLEKSLPEVIDFNFEELKKELKPQLEKYNKLIVAEDSIKSAKSDKATLNKLRTAIEDKRKEVKKSCLKPYELFESKVKEIVSLIDSPILAIDSQIKKFDEIKVNEKKEEINSIYQQNIGELVELLPLAKIYNQRWENTTYPIKEIEEDIKAIISTAVNSLKVIASLKSEFEMQIKDKYFQTLDLASALEEKARLEEQKKKIEEYENTKNTTPVIDIIPTKEQSQEPLEEIIFKVFVTKAQKLELKSFLMANKIKIGRI